MKTLVKRLLQSAGWELRRASQPRERAPTLLAPPLAFESIPGWFSRAEACLLYVLAYLSQGRVLEVGHFLGRSTSAICEGIRASGRRIEFESYDLGFKNSRDFIAYYSKLYGTTSFPVPPEYEHLVYSKGLTTTEIAGHHLARFGLAGMVHLISGDFSEDRTSYDLIFADIMHDPTEIARNLPLVTERSSAHCTWAFHDMTDENIRCVLASSPAVLIARADSLAVFDYNRSKE